ncbi:hypothetical protein CHS0354_030731, partial [Potamilus streckersoni]
MRIPFLVLVTIYLIFISVLVKFPYVDTKSVRPRKYYPKNFIHVKYNARHERELRVSYDKILALETSGFLGNKAELEIRQMTDGKKLILGIYQEGQLKECDNSKSPKQILRFMEQFLAFHMDFDGKDSGDVFDAYNKMNENATSAIQYFDSNSSLKQFHNMVDVKGFTKMCREFMESAKKEVRKHRNDPERPPFADIWRSPLYSQKTLSSEKTAIENGEQKQKQYPQDSIAPIRRSRSKRAVFDFNNVLIFPGTKWCGKGDLAKCYDDLGPDQETDSCCRDHDCCPYIIPPFTSRYNVFNYRFHSLIHCDCDD